MQGLTSAASVKALTKYVCHRVHSCSHLLFLCLSLYHLPTETLLLTLYVDKVLVCLVKGKIITLDVIFIASINNITVHSINAERCQKNVSFQLLFFSSLFEVENAFG